MSAAPGPRPESVLSFTALAIGLVVFVGGWILGNDQLTSLLPGQASMKVNTALALVGLALAVLVLERRGPTRLATVLTAASSAVAALTLVEYVAGVDLGIDNALVVDPSPLYPGRMSPLTTVALIGIGLALQIGARARRASATLAGLALALAALNVLVLWFGARPPVFLESYTNMAITTAVAVGCLALAALVRAAPPTLAVIAARGPGGVMARRLIVAAFAAPVVLGWLRLAGQDLGLFETRFGVTVYGMGMMATLVAVVLMTALTIERTDAARAVAARAAEQLAAVARNTDVAIIGLGLDGAVESWNLAAERLYGCPSADIVGRTLDSITPHGLEVQAAAILADARNGIGTDRLETVRTHRDGRLVHVLLTVSPVIDADGNITGIAHVAIDITERKALALELERSNRELQAFAAIASHDLQEPLRKIQAFGDRLGEMYASELGDQGRDYLARMRGAAVRMQTLIHDLLAYSRVTSTPAATATTDLRLVVGEVLVDLETAIEQAGAVVTIGPLPDVDGDALQMRQLFQNLIGNALKYRRLDAAPEVSVVAEPITTDGSPTGGDSILFWRISVSDNGIGFDAKHAERIFAPFERLHGRTAYEGTGIGLAICKRIVERAGGSILATSVPGEGSSFAITLRASRGERMVAA